MGLKRKGQVTLFFIVAILLVVATTSVFLIYGKTRSTESFPTSVSSATSSLSNSIQSCIEKQTIEATGLFGFQDQEINKYLENTLSSCISPQVDYLSKKYSVESKLEKVNINIDSEGITLTVLYPSKVSLEQESESLSEFKYTILKKTYTPLSINSNCVVQKEANVYSFDNKFKITLRKGTIAKTVEGKCLDKVGIEIVDPEIDYNKRTTSVSRLSYIPLPLGARFDAETVKLELSYTPKDYSDYFYSLESSGIFLEEEKDLEIQYFDPVNSLQLSYPDEESLTNRAIPSEKKIVAEVNWFLNGEILTDSSCFVRKGFVAISPDRRVELSLHKDTLAKKSDGGCLDSLNIIQGPKSSPVVNFGDLDYILAPSGATFNPFITYKYKYTQEQIERPEFLYGWNNWQDLITGNWTSPISIPSNTNALTGRVISGGSSIRARSPEELDIAYFNEEAGFYNPWPTTVDTNAKEVIAEVNHFSINIVAQGCKDENFALFENVNSLTTTDRINNSQNNSFDCNKIKGNSRSADWVNYKIEDKHSCGDLEEMITLVEIIYTEEDSGILFKKEKALRSGENNAFTVKDLTEKDGVLYEERDGVGVCAQADVAMKVVGIGVTHNDGRGVTSKNISSEKYEDLIEGRLCTATTGSGTPCPEGYVNCDRKGGCDHEGSCDTCSLEGSYSGSSSEGVGYSMEYFNRYKGQGDIIFSWVVSGLDDKVVTSKQVEEALQTVRKEVPNTLVSAHPQSGKSLIKDHGINSNSLSYYYVHKCSPGGMSSLISAEANRNPKKPAYLGEPVYEGKFSGCGCSSGCTPTQSSAHISEAIQGGAAGISYGHHSVWSFNLAGKEIGTIPWKTALESEGAKAIERLARGESSVAGECYSRGNSNGSIERIKVSSDGLCFETASGEPFFPITDTAWLLGKLPNSDIEFYIKRRSEQGFNVITWDSREGGNSKNDFIFSTLKKYNMYAEPTINPDKGTSSSGGLSKFLWKPSSDSNSKLVVLYSGATGTASIVDSSGKVIEVGERSTEAGTRNGYQDGTRFSKPGSSYPSGVYVQIGSVRCLIKNPSQRVEKCY